MVEVAGGVWIMLLERPKRGHNCLLNNWQPLVGGHARFMIASGEPPKWEPPNQEPLTME